jgi:hypothetical protein
MGLMNTLMLSCRKATDLMERASMRPLPMGDRMRLWMHLKVCDGCRAFGKQSKIIDDLLAQRDTTFMPVESKPLEDRILKALEDKAS